MNKRSLLIFVSALLVVSLVGNVYLFVSSSKQEKHQVEQLEYVMREMAYKIGGELKFAESSHDLEIIQTSMENLNFLAFKTREVSPLSQQISDQMDLIENMLINEEYLQKTPEQKITIGELFNEKFSSNDISTLENEIFLILE